MTTALLQRALDALIQCREDWENDNPRWHSNATRVMSDIKAALAAPQAQKIAPVQGYTPGIPWSMHLEAYDVYRKKYGAQQELIEGWCRGGFGTRELDDFIPGWRERLSELTSLKTERDALKVAAQAGLEAIESHLIYGCHEQSHTDGLDVAITQLQAALKEQQA